MTEEDRVRGQDVLLCDIPLSRAPGQTLKAIIHPALPVTASPEFVSLPTLLVTSSSPASVFKGGGLLGLPLKFLQRIP